MNGKPLIDMKESDFSVYAAMLLNERVLPLLHAKGDEYGSTQHTGAYANFTAGAGLLGQEPQAYLMALATKQWYVLAQWAQGHRPQMHDELVLERIVDVIVYMTLLSGFVVPQAALEEASKRALELESIADEEDPDDEMGHPDLVDPANYQCMDDPSYAAGVSFAQDLRGFIAQTTAWFNSFFNGLNRNTERVAHPTTGADQESERPVRAPVTVRPGEHLDDEGNIPTC